MSDPDAKLAAFFAAEAPPARDHAFTSEVMQRLARRRLTRELAALSLASLVGAAMLWVLWPILAPVILDLSYALAPAAVAVFAVMAVSLVVTGRPFFGLAART